MSNYPEQILFQAMESLIREGPLAKRLDYALGHLSVLSNEAFEDFTGEGEEKSYAEFRSLWQKVTSQGSAGTTVSQMKENELEQCAQQIHSLYREVMGREW